MVISPRCPNRGHPDQRAYGDCQLHVEWSTPNPPHGTDQDRGNSGVFLHGLYEIQVLDSYDNVTYADGEAAAVYGQYPPLVNACAQARRMADVRHRFSRGALRCQRAM
jgi:hypothetical protein